MRTRQTKDGRFASPEMFDLMQSVSAKEWGENWRTKKKGTASGKSGLTVEQVAARPEHMLD
jgi:hypothetical protein